MQLIFYMHLSMKACYRLILRLFDWYGQAFPKFPKKQVCNVFTISLKKLEMKLTFLMQINIKFPNSWFQHFGHQSFLQCDRHDHENVKDKVMGMIKHSQSTQSYKFALSFQYLWKEVMNGVLDFWCKLSIFHESSQTCPKYQK